MRNFIARLLIVLLPIMIIGPSAMMGVRAYRRTRWRCASSHKNLPLQLHLGCGQKYFADHINIDRNPRANSDMCMDFVHLDRHFKAKSVRQVSMIHSLSYLRIWEARELFRTIHQLLEPQGKLIIELPDIQKVAHALIASHGQPEAHLKAQGAIFAFDMNQVANRDMFYPYHFGWTAWHLEHELKAAGFSHVAMKSTQFHDLSGVQDIRVEAIA